MRYSLLRLLVFFGFLILLWLVHLRGIWLIVGAGLLSAVTSYFLLRGPRAELSHKIEARVDARVKKAEAHRTAEDDEDDEAHGESSPPEDPSTSR